MRWAAVVGAGLGALCGAALGAQAYAQTDDRAALEAEMFGEAPAAVPADGPATVAADAPTTVPTETPPAEGDREAAMFGGGPEDGTTAAGAAPSDRSIESMLAEANDPLTLGARFTLRFDYGGYGDAYDDAPEGTIAPAALQTPALIDLYLDGRPTERVRAFVGARIQQDFVTVSEFFELPLIQLDEAWLKFDLDRRVFLTVGKQRIKWGAARFWNPTDFLNRERLDPLSVVDLRLGVPLIKVHVPFERAGGNLYAVALLDGAAEPQQIGGAGRVEWVIGPSEVSATVVGRKDAPLRIGADVSAGVGPLEVRLEGAVTHGEESPEWVGTWQPEPDGAVPATLPGATDRSDEWIPQAVGSVEWGIPYGDDDTLYVTGEYFYNGAGYDDAELVPWLVGSGSFEPLYTGRHYAGLNVALLAPGDWDDHSFLISGLANLSDRSGLVRLDHQVTALTRLRISTYIGAAVGEAGGEFRLDGLAPSFGPGADPRLDAPIGTTPVAGPRLLAGCWLAVDI